MLNTLVYVIAILLPVAALIALTVYSVKQSRKGIAGKKIIARNLVGFMVALVVIGSCVFAVSAAAADADAAPAEDAMVLSAAEDTAAAPEAAPSAASDGINKGLGLIAAALVTSFAGIGGGIAVAAGAPAAIAATSEDPKSFGKSLIFVALGESIALYGVVISILILNKV
ncbi:MAG: hypothetical protein IJ766_06700 [Clostridia bacterium]|nr:hypothetical protein [Clostridia bacterium]